MSKKTTGYYAGTPKSTDPKTIKRNKIWRIISNNHNRTTSAAIDNLLYKKICAEVFDDTPVSQDELLNLIKNEYTVHIERIIEELNKMIIEDIIK